MNGDGHKRRLSLDRNGEGSRTKREQAAVKAARAFRKDHQRDRGATAALTAILGREAIYQKKVMNWQDLGVEI